MESWFAVQKNVSRKGAKTQRKKEAKKNLALQTSGSLPCKGAKRLAGEGRGGGETEETWRDRRDDGGARGYLPTPAFSTNSLVQTPSVFTASFTSPAFCINAAVAGQMAGSVRPSASGDAGVQ